MGNSILVTGGAGYLGSILVPELLAAGHRVAVLDNFMYDQNSLGHVCANPNFDVVNGDARSVEVLKPLVAKADYVFPLAALVGAPLCKKDPIGATSTNRDAIATLSKLMSPQQRIVMPITNSGYGVGEQGKFCTEDSPLRPVSLYGVTKIEAEKIALERDNSISLRLATVFGMSPRMRIDLLVNNFVYRAVNDRFVVLFEAHFNRNYIHVRDIAKAFIHALNNFDKMKNQPYNVGLSDANLTKLQLCQEIKKLVPDFYFVEAAVGEDPDKRDYIVSNEKIEKTGFKPDVPLYKGLQELIKGYQVIKCNQFANI